MKNDPGSSGDHKRKGRGNERRGLSLSGRSVQKNPGRAALRILLFILSCFDGSGFIGKGRFVFRQNDFEEQKKMENEQQTVADPCCRFRNQQRDPVHIAAAEKAAQHA